MASLGTDINKDYIFKDGDIVLVSDEDNMIQSIMNRLNTRLDELEDFYGEYGSYLKTYIGSRKTNETLRFIEVEINTVLKQDPRLINATSTVEYGTDGRIIINITHVFDEEDEETISLVITSEYGVDLIGS